MSKINEFIKYVNDLHLGRIYTDKTFKELTSLKIGGKISCFFEPLTLDQLIIAYKFLLKENIEFFVIGSGTNILATDSDFDKVVITLKNITKVTELANGIFLVSSGIKSSTLSFNLARLGYTGIEFLSVIPGTIGGVVYMNAGAYGSTIKDIIKEVIFLDENASLVTYDIKDLDFDYRSSTFKNLKGIIIAIVIDVKKAQDKCLPFEKIKHFRESKKLTQPLGVASAGSTFKNGENYKAWEVLDKLGFRGHEENDIVVSNKHPNFIYNNKNATFIDMLNLLDKIKMDAKEKLNIELDCEWIILQ